MLTVENICVRYGRIEAVTDVSLEVRESEIVTIIGANGAGKSTTLMAINGLTRAASGRVMFEGDDITRLPTHVIVRRGIVQVPEGRRILPLLSVEENLELGGHLLSAAARSLACEEMYDRFPRLKERRRQLAGTLSGGEQQMLAIGRALMARPRLLLLDEPSLGLAPNLVDRIFEVIREINQQGTTVLLVEQNAAVALAIANRGYVFENGHVAMSGTSSELRRDDAVRSAYLGQ